MFVNIISTFTEIYLCTLYDQLLGCTQYWGSLLRIYSPDLFLHYFHLLFNRYRCRHSSVERKGDDGLRDID